MARTSKILVAVSATSLLALTLTWAQPGGGGGGGGRRGGFGLFAEQLLGLLAFHPEVELTDEQLVKVRAALRDSYTEQMEMRDAMRSGAVDFQEIREIMSGMRESMMEAVSGELTEEQNEALKEAMAQSSQRGGGRWQGGGGGGGGPP